jgi:hypothetical protein
VKKKMPNSTQLNQPARMMIDVVVESVELLCYFRGRAAGSCLPHRHHDGSHEY